MGLLRFYGRWGDEYSKQLAKLRRDIAQAKAGREGVELHIWFSLSDVSAIVRLIITRLYK